MLAAAALMAAQCTLAIEPRRYGDHLSRAQSAASMNSTIWQLSEHSRRVLTHLTMGALSFREGAMRPILGDRKRATVLSRALGSLRFSINTIYVHFYSMEEALRDSGSPHRTVPYGAYKGSRWLTEAAAVRRDVKRGAERAVGSSVYPIYGSGANFAVDGGPGGDCGATDGANLTSDIQVG